MCNSLDNSHSRKSETIWPSSATESLQESEDTCSVCPVFYDTKTLSTSNKDIQTKNKQNNVIPSSVNKIANEDQVTNAITKPNRSVFTPVKSFEITSPSISYDSESASCVSSRAHSQLSKGSYSSTCVVCMDKEKDIKFLPCNHSQCCLSCFQLSGVHNCPICRSSVSSVIGLRTGLKLPVKLAAPAQKRRALEFHSHSPQTESSINTSMTNITTRRSLPTLRRDTEFESYFSTSRTTSLSNLHIARQAESSIRSLSRIQDVGLRHLRETGCVVNESLTELPDILPARRSSTMTTSDSFSSIATSMHSQERSQQRHNVVLIGPTRKILISLTRKLMSAFPPPRPLKDTSRSKSTLYVNGEAIRLVLVECPLSSIGPEFAARVQRQKPKLVLLCADYFKVSSFESIVRLDMEIIDYLNVPCMWIIVKSAVQKRLKTTNTISNEDVRAATHFLGTSRKTFFVNVIGTTQNANLRRLGVWLFESVSRSDEVRATNHPRQAGFKLNKSRSLSFLCLFGRPKNKKRSFRRSFSGISNWLK